MSEQSLQDLLPLIENYLKVNLQSYTLEDLNALPNKQKINLINIFYNNFPDLDQMVKQGQIQDFSINFSSNDRVAVYIHPIKSIDFITIPIEVTTNG